MRLTTAYYYTPPGRLIQRTGVVPDVAVCKSPKKGGPRALPGDPG
jgi:C-terminal processing protease CtpA/Prc